MNDLKRRVSRILKLSCFLLAAYVLGWGLTEYDAVFMGLILGTSVSLVNALYTGFKVHLFTERMKAGLKPKGMGMLTRFSLVALAALIAVRFPEWFNIIALAVGLLSSTVIMYIDGLVESIRFQRNSEGKGGE